MADGMIDINAKPTEDISVREVFGIDTDMVVKGFPERTDRVPENDSTYKFDPDTTLAILAGFQPQPPRDDPGLSRHRQIDPYRTGRRRG